MGKALIIIPRNARVDDLDAIHSFCARLAFRGYTHRMEYGDQLAVFLDDVEHDFNTLNAQSRLWRRLQTVNFQRLTSTAILPSRGSLDCAGLDLYADIPREMVIHPGEVGFI